jgi:hypothetical protein
MKYQFLSLEMVDILNSSLNTRSGILNFEAIAEPHGPFVGLRDNSSAHHHTGQLSKSSSTPPIPPTGSFPIAVSNPRNIRAGGRYTTRGVTPMTFSLSAPSSSAESSLKAKVVAIAY